MTKFLINKSVTSVLIIAVFMTVSTPMTVRAQTYSQSYQPQTLEEMIAYLYGMIAQLQALLDAKDSDDSQIGVVRPGNTRSDVEVTTLSADDIEENEADIRGRVDLDGEDYAYVWFEYGEDDDDLDDRTSRTKIYDNRGDVRTFSSNIDDLDADERYYYRAIAEDPDGDRDYGSVRYFTTDDDCCSSSSSNDDFDLDVNDTSISEGDSVRVSWELPSDEAGDFNWIGLYEEGDSNSDYITYEYLDDDDSGYVYFEIEDSGEYEFRLFLDNSYNDVATTRTVDVD